MIESSRIDGFTNRVSNTVKNKCRVANPRSVNRFSVETHIGTYSVTYTNTEHMRIIWRSGDAKIEARHREHPDYSWKVKMYNENGEMTNQCTGLNDTIQVEAAVKLFIHHDVVLDDVISFSSGFENRNDRRKELNSYFKSETNTLDAVVQYLRETELLTQEQAMKRVSFGKIK